MSGKRKRGARGELPGMAAWAVAVALAVGVSLGTLVAPGPDGFVALVELPEERAPVWGAGWSSRVSAPEALQASALAEGALRSAVGLAALAGLALLTALLRVMGLRETVRPALAVRWALGAADRTLIGGLLARAGPRLVRACAAGIVAGVAAAVVLRVTWPVEGTGGAPSAWVLLLVPTLAAPLLLALASPVFGLAARSVPLLRTGAGGTDDPRAGTVRRAAATLQIAAAAALVLAGSTLGVRSDGPVTDDPVAGSDTLLLPLRPVAAGVDWGAVERLLGATAPESLSTPGAWTGRGVRDLVTVECGRCSRGGLPLPMYGVAATLHAVSPGFFGGAGLALVDGRAFTPADSAGAPPIGIVSAPFARDHFEDGRPLGKRIRLGGPGDRWVTVVGVVEALPYQAPGSAAPDAPVLYLPLAQHPSAAAVWALPGAAEALPALPPGAPVAEAGPPVSVTAARDDARAPVRWVGRTLLVAGFVGLLLALAGAAEVAAAEARGRWREAAVRAAVGSPPARLVARFLRRVLATALLGSTLGWILAWSLVASTAGAAAIRPGAVATLVALIALATLSGAAGPARRAAGSDPAVLLREAR